MLRFPIGATDFYFLEDVKTGSELHRASYLLGTGAHFPGRNYPDLGTDHSSPSSDFENELNNYSSPLYASWCVEGQFYCT